MDRLPFTLHLQFFTLLVLFLVESSICRDGDFGQMSACCTYKDLEKVDLEYEIRYTYNKKLLMEYNSTRGNWTGFTESGLTWAGYYNSDPEDAKQRLEEMIALCSDNIHAIRDSKNLTATPSLKLTSVKQSSGTEPALLSCSAYNFYPKEIEMTWLLNGQEITSAVSSTDVLSDGDLFYQIHSYLEYSPKPGEDISCMVEHVSLPEPLVQTWDSSPPQPEKVKIAVGTFFLVLGLLVMFTGFIYYKKQCVGHCAFFQGHRMTPVEVVHEDRRTSDEMQQNWSS